MPTCTNTSSTLPLGFLIDLSAKERVTLVGLSYDKPNCLKTKYGRMLTLAPKSSRAFSIFVSPMVTDMVGHPGSLC